MDTPALNPPAACPDGMFGFTSRDGKVSTYLPAQQKIEEIDALVQKIVRPATTSSQGQQ